MLSRPQTTTEIKALLIEQKAQAENNGYKNGAHNKIDAQRAKKVYKPKTLREQNTALNFYTQYGMIAQAVETC